VWPMMYATATSTNDTSAMPARRRARSDIVPYFSRSAYPKPRTVWMRRGSAWSIFLRR
jgi:hypothetical protein